MKKISVEEAKKVTLDIMDTISQICEKNSIEYSLLYGTMIGAIRHKGFIPWDDDLDIGMEREYYDKFIEYFKQHEEELKPLKLYHYTTQKDYPHLIARVGDTRYPIKQLHEKQYEMCVFVDIYPLDYAKKNYKSMINRTLACSLVMVNKDLYKDVSVLRKTKLKISAVLSRLFYKKYYKRVEDYLRSTKDRNYELEGSIAWLEDPFEKVLFPSEWYKETIYLPFENKQFKVFKHYDKMLKAIYGDYMELPDESDRIGHHFYEVYKYE